MVYVDHPVFGLSLGEHKVKHVCKEGAKHQPLRTCMKII